MGILGQLTEKPWEQTAATSLALKPGMSFSASAKTVALRTFLCVVTVLFTLMVAAYAERMAYEDWRPTPQQGLLWLNTGLLVASSIAFHWTLISARNGRVQQARTGLFAAGALAIAFLVGQVLAWRQLDAMTVFDITNPAIAFFIMITALHGLHLLGGLVAWGRAIGRMTGDGEAAAAIPLLRLCATYWHYLLVLWLVLFGLLFSGNDHLTTLLEICGLR